MGSVFFWGVYNRKQVPLEVRLFSPAAVSCAAGKDHSLLLLKAGSLVTCGIGSKGIFETCELSVTHATFSMIAAGHCVS